MARRYYSSRVKPKSLTLGELYWKFQHFYLMFRDKDFFKGKAGITRTDLPDAIKHKAAVALTFQPFSITQWSKEDITEDHIFDVLEFLYDHVSKPGESVGMTTDSGWNYYDYDGYDEEAGQEEFRNVANAFLADYKVGFEVTKDGSVLAMGTGGIQYILEEEIIPYDEINVDSKVRNAITKWRNRHLSISEKKEAIRELADVFEWLKRTKNLGTVLNKKDESAIFALANNFGIRHHNQDQKTNYDHEIWYLWIFHFYLATYHAAIRLLVKKEKDMGRLAKQEQSIHPPVEPSSPDPRKRILEAIKLRKHAPKCPKHNVPMLLKKGKNGDFWGCPFYKQKGCRETRNIDAKELPG